MSYYTERHGLRKPITKTYNIDPERYGIILKCCEKYYDNIAWKFPRACEDGIWDCCGLDKLQLATEMRFEIPNLFISQSGKIGIPSVIYSIFEDEPYVDEYDQYSLLDFIEFMYANIRDVNKEEYHSFHRHYHLKTLNTTDNKNQFRDDINNCFKKTNLLYFLNSNGEVERIIENSVLSDEVIDTVLSIDDKGINELLKEAIDLHRSHNPSASRNAVEKLWDAFERLKTYYVQFDKKDSSNKIIADMAGDSEDYKELFKDEFMKLTKIGNNYRIRHHETDKIEINDDRYYDYFFNRCLSLIALAVQYIK